MSRHDPLKSDHLTGIMFHRGETLKKNSLLGGFFMEMKEAFTHIKQKLHGLAEQYAQNKLQFSEFEKELRSIQKESEMILEEWIELEDLLAHYKQFGTQTVYDEGGPDLHSSPSLTNEEQIQQWKRAKALYDLQMFPEAIRRLESLLSEVPDFEPARLYLGQAYLAHSQTDKAKYHLQFLAETSRRPEFTQLAVHALACIEGTLKNYAQADHYFQKLRVDELREEWQPIVLYNHAQTLYQLKHFDLCQQKFSAYHQLVPDDWKGLFMLGMVHHQLGDEETGFAFWFEALQHQENPDLLLAMARQFEQKTYFQMAAHCYERFMKVNTRTMKQQAWFGLAWNYGLAGDKEKSRRTFLKALTLFPQDTDLQMAYVWMLLLWNEKEKAGQAIDLLAQRHGNHPLIQGLKHLQNEDYERTYAVLEQVNAR